MTKAEMELHRAGYHALMNAAREAKELGLFRKAVELALATWPHVDGMMQYALKFENTEFQTVESIDMVLAYAPILLDYHSLDALGELLKAKRRIERNTSEDFDEKLATARSLMWDSHRLWAHLEEHPEIRQDELSRFESDDQLHWSDVIQLWELMGLVSRSGTGSSARLAIYTRMGEVVSAKCPHCGSISEAPKAMFLEQVACPDCKAAGWFVLLPRDSQDSKG